MKNYKYYFFVLLLFVGELQAVNYLNLETYKTNKVIHTYPDKIDENIIEENWGMLIQSLNETFVSAMIDSESFWNTLKNSVSENSVLYIAANYQVTQNDKGSNLFLKAIYKSIKQIPVIYKSTTPYRDSVMLSGKIFLPVTKDVKGIIVANHYTICANQEAPSQANSIEGIFATKDYIVLMPDYLGYGVSDTIPHPYLHIESTVMSSIDLLDAALPYLRVLSYDTSLPLILIGYSQGAAVTLAMQKKIETEYSNKYTISHVYVGAGPYDLAYTYDYYLKNETIEIPCALPMIITGMSYGENLNLSQDEYFQQKLKDLYPITIASKQKTLVEVNKILGRNIKELLKPLAFAKDSFPTSKLYNALQNNSISAWNPTSRLFMFHSVEDEIVPIQNSQVLYTYFQEQKLENIEFDSNMYGNHMTAAVTFLEKVYRRL